MGWQPNYQTEARIYANYIKKNMPDAKVAILYQNDDYGKDYLQGMKDGLGDMASKMIVAEESYEVTEPTIDSRIIPLTARCADVFCTVTTPNSVAQPIRKAAALGWKPTHFPNNLSNSATSWRSTACTTHTIGRTSPTSHQHPT